MTVVWRFRIADVFEVIDYPNAVCELCILGAVYRLSLRFFGFSNSEYANIGEFKTIAVSLFMIAILEYPPDKANPRTHTVSNNNSNRFCRMNV